MSATIINHNINSNNLLEDVRNLFKNYGLSMNEGINLLIKQIELPISKEPLSPEDEDYKFLENKPKNPENYVKFDDINWD